MRPTLAMLAATLATLRRAPAALRPDGNDADLAKQLSNPVASLISVPFQFNYNQRLRRRRRRADLPEHPAGDPDLDQPGLEPHLAHHRADRQPGRRRPRRGLASSASATPPRASSSRRRRRPARPDLGRRPRLPDPDRDRRHRAEPVGRRRHRRRAEADRAVDGRRARQPHLVGHRQRPVRRLLADLPAAVPELHHAEGDLVHPQHRVDLQLGERGVVGADQLPRRARCSSSAASRSRSASAPATGPTRPRPGPTAGAPASS